MANKMLIDATHPEETRVVVLRGNRVEEFDFEAANRKQLRGNIYLAKVTRVEPSLQAAFVDYGGNRHGFLAFSEIHPDYYQIPVADRQALLEEERMRRGSDDDFEPVDDEADFQEIEEIDEDEFDDSSAESDDDEAKPRKSRSGRGRTNRNRNGRGKARAASEDAGDGDEAAADVAAEAGAPEAPDDAETSAAGAGSSDAAPGTGEGTGENGSSADGDGASDKPVPDRFLAASEDDDAVLSDDLTQDQPEKAETDADEESRGAKAAAPQESVEDPSGEEPSPADIGESSAEAESEPTGQEAPSDAVEADAASQDAPETASAEPAEEEKASSGDTGIEAKQTDDADADEEKPARAPSKRHQRNSESSTSRPPRRRYKIQEVIKRRQIILVQVVKEERGTKGAALTTYLSLAGRYSVLMPNSGRGGGISRKITNPGDRKRLKQIANDLPVPEGMGVILRTAGASRTKTEVKRDFEYLMRLWENVRDLTLQSSAPALVYEEGNLVKRSIRDLYNKDIDEVLVAGETGYREAKDFMRMLMPSHAKNVQPYKDQVPIFARNRVEPQLDAMFLPRVTLPSGGYIIINQTEALVAVDVNSGKATREHNIEDTALRTNVEAAEEMARQLRLRDLAGLIVIDFIDMEEKRNNRTVERKLKDCLKTDRARIQVGRISHFGLLEMSRQRLRTGVLESSTELCPHCHGTGVIRSTESVALHVLRTIEDQLLRSASHNLNVRIRTEVALYIINNKRYSLTDMEDRYGIQLNLVADETIQEAYCIIERTGLAESRRAPPTQNSDIIHPETIDPDDNSDDEAVDDTVSEDANGSLGNGAEEDDADGAPKKRRRKRRRRGRDSETSDQSEPAESRTADDGGNDQAEPAEGSEAASEDENGKDDAAGKKRRRGRRGGRRNKRTDAETTAQEAAEKAEAASNDAPRTGDAAEAEAAETDPGAVPGRDAVASDPGVVDEDASDERQPVTEAGETLPAEDEAAIGDEAAAPAETGAKDDQSALAPNMEAGEETPGSSESPETNDKSASQAATDEPEESDRPKKSGWWQKRSFFK